MIATADERYLRLRRVVERATPEQIRRFAASLEGEDLGLLEEVVADMAAEVEREAEGHVHWRSDPARMALHFEPETYQPHPYFMLLGRKFRELVDGTDPYQIWMVPAQHGKSSIASQYGPAWDLDRRPAKRWVLTTYGDELADRNGLAVRDILNEHSDVLRATLRRDQHRKDRFLTTEGGGVLAAGLHSIGGGWSATGGVVVDDPYKGWEQAHSAAVRNKTWNIVVSTVWKRRSDDNVPMLVCTTRWHEEDLAARLAGLEFELGVRFSVVRLAQYAEAPDPEAIDPMLRLPDPLGRAPGEHLGRFSIAKIEMDRTLNGEYLFAAMEQQRPAPAEGTEILREWFQIADTLPPKADQAIASWDMKAKDKEQGDYVVGGLWWRVGGGYWLMDVLRGQWDNATAKAAMALMKVRHPEITIQYFENAGNAPELTAELRRGDPDYVVSDRVADKLGMTTEREALQKLMRHGLSSLVPVVPKGDKTIRMRAVSPVIEGRNVHLPAGAKWLPAYLDEMAAFGSGGGHDDQVDMTSQALAKLTKASGSVSSASQAQGRDAPAPRIPTRASSVAGGGSSTPRTSILTPRTPRP